MIETDVTSIRYRLANSPNLIYQNPSQKSDLLDTEITQTDLIAYLWSIISKGHILEVTACKSDHGNDSDLGLHCHYNGYCIDCWPLWSRRPGDYMMQNTPDFLKFLEDANISLDRYQVGLGGAAWTHADAVAAGSSVFQDNGADHVHLGAQ